MCVFHMVFRVLVQALRIPTHGDHPFLSAFCDVSRIHVRDVSNPFVSARDITSFNFMGKECFAAGRMEEAPAMHVSRVNIGCADNSQESSPCRHGCTVARMRKRCRDHNVACKRCSRSVHEYDLFPCVPTLSFHPLSG